MNKLLFAALPLVMGCSIFGVEDDLGPFTFEIRDTEFGGHPSIGVFVATAKIFTCDEHLDGRVGADFEGRIVDIYGVASSGSPCTGYSAPAQFRGNVGDFPNGSFRLTFQHNGRYDAYTVTVTDTVIVVAPRLSRFTRPAALRFPRPT